MHHSLRNLAKLRMQQHESFLYSLVKPAITPAEAERQRRVRARANDRAERIFLQADCADGYQ